MDNDIKVLIVDDEEEILKTIKRYLTFFDKIKIHTASSFEEASQLIEELRPSIAILDISLPDGNGLDLISRFRKYSKVNQAIIITAASDITRVLDAIDLGAVDYLRKPLDMEELRLVVNESINRFKRWRELTLDEFRLKH